MGNPTEKTKSGNNLSVYDKLPPVRKLELKVRLDKFKLKLRTPAPSSHALVNAWANIVFDDTYHDGVKWLNQC